MPERPRVLVLGGSGLLGGHLLGRFPASFRTLATPPRVGASSMDERIECVPLRFDAADPSSVAPILDAACPDVIVNAVGARLPSDAAVMDAVNGRFPHVLAALAGARGARVIHVSTDGVFSGARGGYAECDAPDPADAYGRSKLAGELAAPHLTLHTSFFGCHPRGEGLLGWLARQHGTVDGFIDYRFTGVAASILADLIAVALPLGLGGVYHVGGEPLTKFDLLVAAADRLALDTTVNRATRVAIDRTLDSSKFFSAIGRRRPTLADSLDALSSCGALSHN